MDKAIKVVIIEDYALFRIGLVSILNKDEEIDVVGQVESGEEGLEVARRLNPDVFIVDLGLPGIDGIETIQRLKELSDNYRFIVLTSHETTEEVLAAMAAGANAYCLKDVPSERLTEIVKFVEDGAAWLDPSIARVVLDNVSEAEEGSSADAEALRQSLSPRELHILELLVQGKSNNDIADQLYVSVHTVKTQVSSILEKLAVNDRVQAAVKAVRTGIVQS